MWRVRPQFWFGALSDFCSSLTARPPCSWYGPRFDLHFQMHLCAFFYAGTALVLSVKFSFARTLSGSSALSRFRSVSASHARRALSKRAWLSPACLCFRPHALSLEHARAPCLPIFLPRSLALVLAQFLSLPLSPSPPLALPPPRSLPRFLEAPSSYSCSHFFMFALWRLMLSMQNNTVLTKQNKTLYLAGHHGLHKH